MACLICCGTVNKPPVRQGNLNLLDEELCVYFFVQKFILKDINGIFSPQVFESEGRDIVDFEKYLMSGKGLRESVKFCISCDKHVKKAKEAYGKLCTLLVQLRNLQKELRNKLRNSFKEENAKGSKRRSDKSLRGAIRRTLKEHLNDGVNEAEFTMKIEIQPDFFVPPSIVKTEPNYDAFLDDDFTVDDNELTPDLKEFVISPIVSITTDRNESSKEDSKSKKVKQRTNRKTEKPKKRFIKKKLVPKAPKTLEELPEAPPSNSLEISGGIPSVEKRGRKPGGTKRTCVPVERRTCPVCGAIFARAITMKYHLNAAHEKKEMFNCPVGECGKTFYLKETYNIHVKRHLSKEQIRHLILADKFHLVKLSDGTEFNLEETMDEIEKLNLSEHSVNVVDQILNRTCPTCRKIFETEAASQYHQKVHHNKNTSTDSRYVCEKCGKSYSLLSTYKTHIKFDHADFTPLNDEEDNTTGQSIKPKPFKCDVEGCNRSFLRPEYVRNHKKNFHHLGKTQRANLCSFCGKELMTGPSLKRHIFTHHTENAPRKHKCHLCEKSFLTSTLLKKHLMCKSHGGQGRPWAKTKWNPKYNLSRKKKTTPVHSSKESRSVPNYGDKRNQFIHTNSSVAAGSTWFQNQVDLLNPSNASLVIAKEILCTPQDFQSPNF